MKFNNLKYKIKKFLMSFLQLKIIKIILQQLQKKEKYFANKKNKIKCEINNVLFYKIKLTFLKVKIKLNNNFIIQFKIQNYHIQKKRIMFIF